MNNLLQKRAEEFSALIEDRAMDDVYIVRMMLDYETREIVTEKNNIPKILGSDIPGHIFMPYEDAGMTTGAYLAAQSLNYQTTCSADALRRAKKAFSAVCYIYELGQNGRCEGFFPKPYGAQFSEHCSRDQYLFVMSGLVEYYQIADENERLQIKNMLEKMAQFWRDINYSPGFFSMKKTPQLYDYIAPVFLGIAGMPCRLSDNETCRKEVARLLDEEHLRENALGTLRERFRQGELYDGAQYYRQNENPLMMKSLAMHHLWEISEEYHDFCREVLQKSFYDDLFVELADDGLNYYIMKYKRETDSFSMTSAGKIDEIQNPVNLPFLSWGGERRRAGSTQSIFAAIIIAARLGRKDIAEKAKNVLEKLTIDKFRGFTYPVQEDIPPGSEYASSVLSCNYMSFWLWDYYLGKKFNLW